MPHEHDLIIKQAAKSILAPIGMFQKGQSRVWLDDNSWFITQVEFQPSGLSRGSFLNVGVGFLWGNTVNDNDNLNINLGWREKGFIEYSNSEEFYSKMLEYAEYAKNKVLYYRSFINVNFAIQEIISHKYISPVSKYWDLAMIHFFNGNTNRGREYLLETLNQCIHSNNIDFYNMINNRILPLSENADMIHKCVQDSIIQKRKLLRCKSSMKNLKVDPIYQ